ncbi:ribonucleotide reductase subunit alpha [Halopseudomonas phragmitis]|uniref:Ribonucleotide reductase subunit alpha n=2 Tax=Pseudomonadaceae TaxID=135621 RepID=A0A1V0B710_9GAMM|nr:MULTISPECIES: ribonucleotide reductase subunit alpha [Pseudomonadaceae]AQZ95718.1 ribonucleotide reductase subunit alpha [Halopseudomonas phragmitis]PAU87158.1 ribonucleotide reductase subunit alpha [Pseudomonas sp. WN033]RHW22686.1 ribonucleotide reductase subunit alpha [Pseudomonas jilinensis]
MTIQSYADFIQAARSQSEPQRLLFVFARAELPEGATEEQRLQFEQGIGGALSPVLCVDKLPHQAANFADLVAESQQTGVHWDLAFVSAMSGRGGITPNSDEAEQPLKMMMEQIQAGMVAQFLAISRAGELIELY